MAFSAALKAENCVLHHVQTDSLHCYTHFLQVLNDLEPVDAVVLTNYHLAENFSNVSKTFYPHLHSPIYTISPLFTIPSVGCKKYELNYRLMGRCAAEQLIKRKENKRSEIQPMILHNDGMRNWLSKIPGSTCKRLTILTLDSPTARIMENMARIYTDATGIEIKVAICSYDGIHEILSDLGNTDAYDVIRLDHTWLSWFGEIFLRP